MSLEKKLLRYARVVDTIDAVTGPLSLFLEASEDPLYQTAGQVVAGFEFWAVKLPFIIYSMAQTKSVIDPVAMFGIEEVLDYVSPLSRLGDIVPLYTWRTKLLLEKRKV